MSVLVSSAYTYTTLFMIMISDESGSRNALKARRTVIFAVQDFLHFSSKFDDFHNTEHQSALQNFEKATNEYKIWHLTNLPEPHSTS